MKCRFCGCTEKRACQIPMTFIAEDSAKPAIAMPGQVSLFTLSCDWLIPNVCTHPLCVEKAYAEACALVDELIAMEEAA